MTKTFTGEEVSRAKDLIQSNINNDAHVLHVTLKEIGH